MCRWCAVACNYSEAMIMLGGMTQTFKPTMHEAWIMKNNELMTLTFFTWYGHGRSKKSGIVCVFACFFFLSFLFVFMVVSLVFLYTSIAFHPWRWIPKLRNQGIGAAHKQLKSVEPSWFYWFISNLFHPCEGEFQNLVIK